VDAQGGCLTRVRTEAAGRQGRQDVCGSSRLAKPAPCKCEDHAVCKELAMKMLMHQAPMTLRILTAGHG
jgi:hypothetical protein